MKLLSYAVRGREAWGAVQGDRIVPLAERTGCADLATFIGSDAFHQRDRLVAGLQGELAMADVKLLPPIPRSEKIVCVLRNYRDPQKEAAGTQPEATEQPPIFLRVWRSQVAHGDALVEPRVSATLDWEGELAVIIGKPGRDIPEERAYDHVAGYSIYNDASVREWQSHAKQVASGKNFEGTGGFGPWMVTADEIQPGQRLRLVTRLNDEVVQDGDTDQMIFSTARLIHYASTIFTLVPGDVIVTGTPAGMGFTRKPPRFMKPGDVVEVEIERIGVLRNPVVAQS